MKKALLCIWLLVTLFACKDANKIKGKEITVVKEKFKEKHRPQFHFTPEKSWMNDPNGLVYNKGVYHLFYQYYPDATVWGPMHWGHTTSKDMVYWEHKPIALYPDDKGFIFSGSAVVDKENTSGFGINGEAPLVAIYTYFRIDIEKKGGVNTQTQGMAYSLDNGDTWQKYAGNPIIDNTTLKDFRDPKVFWHQESKSWIMTLVAGDHVKLYRSLNLKEWDQISEFGKNQGAHGGVWECPDLFKLKVEGTNEEKWVLLISIGTGGPNGGSGTQYFIGDFNGTSFTSDQTEFKWLDWGTDNYAGVTYNNMPNQERVFIGWMSNWQYAVSTPTKTWRSAMTIPRKLSLQKYGNTYLLNNYPIRTIDTLVEEAKEDKINIDAKESWIQDYQSLNGTEISFKTASKNFELNLANSKAENISIKFDPVSKLILLDRTKSGIVDFQLDFGNKLHYMPIDKLPDTTYEIRMLIDRSSIELFINNGQYVMTEQFFPTEEYTRLKIKSNAEETIQLKNFRVAKIASIWE